MHSIRGIGDKKLFKIEKAIGGMENLEAISNEKLRQLLGEKGYEQYQSIKPTGGVEYLKGLKEKGIRYIPYDDEIYPEKLKNIPDMPYGLFVKGQLPNPNRLCVAIVGARACSPYGVEVTKRITRELVKNGIQTISGLAYGIDSICHKETIKQVGRTFAVLGCGVDICYPKCFEDVYENMVSKSGGVISNYAMGMQPLASNFPPRNRIISGLCDALIVIEAKQKSGTLITVDMALEQGKEIFVLPGRITDDLSCGCNQLIAQGARIIANLQTLIEELLELKRAKIEVNNGVKSSEVASTINCKNVQDEQLRMDIEGLELKNPSIGSKNISDTEERIVIKSLKGNRMDINELYYEYRRNTGKKAIPKFLSLLREMELEYLIGQEGGVYFLRG